MRRRSLSRSRRYHMTTLKVFMCFTFGKKVRSRKKGERLLSDNRMECKYIIYKVLAFLGLFLKKGGTSFASRKLISLVFTFRVGETGAWDELPEVHTNNSIASYVVKKLLPFTVYSFRILAVNRLGVSLASKESYYICTLREGKHWVNNDSFKGINESKSEN